MELVLPQRELGRETLYVSIKNLCKRLQGTTDQPAGEL